MILNNSEKQAFYDTAAELRILNPEWLIDLVRFETAGTFSPAIKNPLSSARGLIQFMDSTARGLGFADSLDLVDSYPTVEDQLKGPVYDYLRPYSPFNEEFQLYMAVFFPAARKYSADTPFSTIFKNIYGNDWESRYSAFIKSNPRILTPGDYVSLLKKKSKIITYGIPILAIVGVLGIWFYLRNRQKTLN